MLPQTTTNRLVTRASLAFAAQVILTSVHHIYGGLVYDSAFRLSMPILAGVELLIVLGLLFWYRRTRNAIGLTLFGIVSVLVGVVQGLFHTLYGHFCKDLLFLAGVTVDTVRGYYFPIIPNDFVYPPNDIFFEVTGLLEVITICVIAYFTYQLIRDRNSNKSTT